MTKQWFSLRVPIDMDNEENSSFVRCTNEFVFNVIFLVLNIKLINKADSFLQHSIKHIKRFEGITSEMMIPRQ